RRPSAGSSRSGLRHEGATGRAAQRERDLVHLLLLRAKPFDPPAVEHPVTQLVDHLPVAQRLLVLLQARGDLVVRRAADLVRVADALLEPAHHEGEIPHVAHGTARSVRAVEADQPRLAGGLERPTRALGGLRLGPGVGELPRAVALALLPQV